MLLNDLMVMKQARKYKKLNTEGECQYSEAWLQKFKKWYGVKYLKICGKKPSENETAENCIDEFTNINRGN